MLRAWRVPAALWIAILALLAAHLAFTAIAYYPGHWSMDLYHPWGIPQAHAALGRATNPYADTVRYGEHLQALTRASPDRSLQWIGNFWLHRSPVGIEPTATPFFYAAHALAPGDFDAFHLLNTTTEYGAILFAVFLLARLRGAKALPAACAAALVAGAFNPFIENVRVGNVSAMQLAVLAAMIGLAQARVWERSVAVDRGYLAVLAHFVLFKPNAVFIAAGLAAHYAAVRGARRAGIGAAIAAVAVLLAAACAASYFGSAAVWSDWLGYLNGVNGGTLLYALDKGNIALPVLMFERAGAYAPQTWALIFGLIFAVVLLACASGQGRGRIAPAGRAWLADPWIAASIPAIATFMASPLLWPHYLVLALIPIAWLARPGASRNWAVACAVAAFLCLSLLVLGPLIYAGMGRVAYAVMSVAWVWLLPAALTRLSQAAREAPA
jgi:hypothetical protein